MLKGTAIRSGSYHYAVPQKTKIIYFWSYACMWASNLPATSCACAFFVSEMSVVPQPIGIRVLTSWPIVAFGSVPALMLCVTSWWDFRFQSLQIAMPKREAESELPGDKSRQKKRAHQNFWEEYDTEQFLCVVWSTQSTKHVKCSACFFSSWDFSVALGGMYGVEQCVSLKHHINKGKAIGSTPKSSH